MYSGLTPRRMLLTRLGSHLSSHHLSSHHLSSRHLSSLHLSSCHLSSRHKDWKIRASDLVIDWLTLSSLGHRCAPRPTCVLRTCAHCSVHTIHYVLLHYGTRWVLFLRLLFFTLPVWSSVCVIINNSDVCLLDYLLHPSVHSHAAVCTEMSKRSMLTKLDESSSIMLNLIFTSLFLSQHLFLSLSPSLSLSLSLCLSKNN